MSDDEQEIERLRARIADLESQVGSAPDETQVHGSAGRAVASTILIVVACLLAPLSVVSVWASTQISDTDQYVQTVAPLVDETAVRQAISDEVTTAVLENLDIQGVTTDLLSTLASQDNVPPRLAVALPGLAVPLTNGIEGFVRDQVDAVLASDQFADVWVQVNQVAHEQVVRLLEGKQGGAVTAQDDQITLNLAPIVETVKQRMVDRGFTLASNIPAVDRQFVLVQSGSISQAQFAYQALNWLGAWLPLVALLLLAGGVALARDRRRALLRGALGVAGALLALGVALTLARLWYVNATPADVLTAEAAGNVFDTLVRFLRTGLRSLGILALIVALAAFVAGPSAGAARTRSVFQGGVGSMRGGAEQAGWSTGRFGTWMFDHKRLLRILTFVGAGLVLMLWTRPSGWVVIWTAVVVLLVLVLLEFLATPPVVTAADPDHDTAPVG